MAIFHTSSASTQQILATVIITLGLALGGGVHAQDDNGLQLGGDDSGASDDAPPKLDLGASPAKGDESGSSDADTPASVSPDNTDSAAPSGKIKRTTHGDWEVACGGGNCAMMQVGEDSEDVPVMEVVLRKLKEPLKVGDQSATAVLDIITPLGVVLIEGVGMTIDDGPTEAAPFQICTEQGCLVREPISDELIGRMKRGKVAKLSVVAASRGEVVTDISLSGFTAAYDSM